MKNSGRVASTLIVAAALGVSDASAEQCRSRIQTVDTMLVRLAEEPAPAPIATGNGGPLWRIDVAAAQELLGLAKADLEDGLEFDCQFHVAEALRRLGRLQ